MIYNVYCVRDVVADDTICLFYAVTDGVAVRDNLPALSRVRPVDDLRLYRVGTFDSNKQELVSHDPLLIDWDCYKFPEMPGTPPKIVENKIDKSKK